MLLYLPGFPFFPAFILVGETTAKLKHQNCEANKIYEFDTFFDYLRPLRTYIDP